MSTRLLDIIIDPSGDPSTLNAEAVAIGIDSQNICTAYTPGS